MNKKVFTILVFVVFSILAFTACENKPEESVAKEIVPNLLDNGKNLGWINVTNSTKTMQLLQQWIDEHPTKRVVTISSDGTGSYGAQNGWLFIYENKVDLPYRVNKTP